MLDIRSHSQLAEATADMVRACAFATARAAGASMFQGMSMWSRMLRSSAASPAQVSAAWAAHSWNPVEDWAAWSRACMPRLNAPREQVAVEPPADAAFSSYRSSSGHAVAQVIVAG